MSWQIIRIVVIDSINVDSNVIAANAQHRNSSELCTRSACALLLVACQHTVASVCVRSSVCCIV